MPSKSRAISRANQAPASLRYQARSSAGRTRRSLGSARNSGSNRSARPPMTLVVGMVAMPARTSSSRTCLTAAGISGPALSTSQFHSPCTTASGRVLTAKRWAESELACMRTGSRRAWLAADHLADELGRRRGQLAAIAPEAPLEEGLDADPSRGGDPGHRRRRRVVGRRYTGRHAPRLPWVVEEVGEQREADGGWRERHRIAVGESEPRAAVEDGRADRRGADGLDSLAVRDVQVDHRREAEVEVAPGQLAEVSLGQGRRRGDLLVGHAGDPGQVDVPVDEAGHQIPAGPVNLPDAGRHSGWHGRADPRDPLATDEDVGVPAAARPAPARRGSRPGSRPPRLGREGRDCRTSRRRCNRAVPHNRSAGGASAWPSFTSLDVGLGFIENHCDVMTISESSTAEGLRGWPSNPRPGRSRRRARSSRGSRRSPRTR